MTNRKVHHLGEQLLGAERGDQLKMGGRTPGEITGDKRISNIAVILPLPCLFAKSLRQIFL